MSGPTAGTLKRDPLPALRRANEIRLDIAAYLAQVRAGEVTLADAVKSCELPIRLDQLLKAGRRVGGNRSVALCAAAGLGDPMFYAVAGKYGARGLRPLTPRERATLAGVCKDAGL